MPLWRPTRKEWAQARAQAIRDAFDAGYWAGFGQRLAAQWMDAWIFFFPGFLIPTAVAEAIVGLPLSTMLLVLLPIGTISALEAAHQTLFVGGGNRPTPGREAKRIAIVDASSGQRISFGRGYLRCVLSLLGSVLVLPNLMLIFTTRKQSAADFLAHTVGVHYKQAAPAVSAAAKRRAFWVNLFLIAAIIGLGYATFGQFFSLMAENDTLIPIRNDLASYTDLLETYSRKNGAMPPTIYSLRYEPESYSTQYVLTPDGVLYAHFTLGPWWHSHKSYYSLYPEYDAATGATRWRCRSLGISEPLRRHCPGSPMADPSRVGKR